MRILFLLLLFSCVKKLTVVDVVNDGPVRKEIFYSGSYSWVKYNVRNDSFCVQTDGHYSVTIPCKFFNTLRFELSKKEVMP